MADPLALELEAIRRGISKADLMQQQAMAPRQIISPTQGLAQLAQAFVAGRAGQKAQERLSEYEKKIGERDSAFQARVDAARQSGDANALANVLLESRDPNVRAAATSTILKAQQAQSEAESESETIRKLGEARKAIAPESLKSLTDEQLGILDKSTFQKIIGGGDVSYQFRTVGDRVVALDPKNPRGAPIDIGPAGESQTAAVVKAMQDASTMKESKSKRDQDRADFIDKYRSTESFVRNANGLIDFVTKNPASATITGSLAGVVDSAYAAAVAARDQINIAKGSKFSSDMNDYKLGEVSGLASATSEERARVFSLAYALAAAKGQTGHSVSDGDIKRFLGMIAGSYKSPNQLTRTLGTIRDEIIGDYKTEKKIAKANGILTDEQLKEFDIGGQADVEGVGLAPLPEGVNLPDGIHTDANGNRIEVVNGQYREL